MDAQRKAKLGTRWSCYSCGAKFYDLNKPEPICPRCQADQRQSPRFAEQPKSKRVRPPKKAPMRPIPEPRAPIPLEPDTDTELDFEDVELIAPEGMGLDTADDDEPGADAPDDVELD